MAIEDVTANEAIQDDIYANETNLFDIGELNKYSRGKSVHNIAAVLHLVQHLISELHGIADSIKKEKASALENWTKQAKKASESTESEGQWAMGEAAGPIFKTLSPLINDPQIKNLVDTFAPMACKLGSNMKVQEHRAESQEHVQRSQLHQSDKEGLQTASQSLDQSLNSAVEGLRGALSTIGSMNKDGIGR